MSGKKSKAGASTIVLNKRARFDYHLHERFEAGIALEGWEVKSLRAGKCQLTDAFVLLKDGEAWLHGCNITPLNTAAAHVSMNPKRQRKLLLHRRELARLIGATGQKGQTCVLLALYWKANKVKCDLALATGKRHHDKRETIKARDWNRDKARLMKSVDRQ